MAERARVPWSVRREQVAELMSRHEREGRPVRELAREAGLPVAAIYGWLKRFRQETARDAVADHGAGFVELVAESSADSASTVCMAEIVLGSGLRIRVGEHFDANAVRRLVAALSG